MNLDELLTKRDLIECEQRLNSKIAKTREQSAFPNYLRSKDVCKMLNISPSTLQNFRLNGKIPFKKLGGTIFYEREEIEKAIANI